MIKVFKYTFGSAAFALITACGGGEIGSDEYIAPSYGSIATNRITGSGAITANYSWQGGANSNAIDRCGLAALQCLSSAPICVVPWHAVTVLLLGGQVIPANQMQKVMRYLHVQRAVVLTA